MVRCGTVTWMRVVRDSMGANQMVYRSDEDREVRLDDDELVVLPDQTRDDTDNGWGERVRANDIRLLEERPPHWD